MPELKLVGPFSQILTMSGLRLKGPISDDDLTIITEGGILLEGAFIKEIGKFDDLVSSTKKLKTPIHKIINKGVALPGFIDAHTHICFSGSRSRDYALRNSGSSYLEIAKSGGGIWDTVIKTREASQKELAKCVIERSRKLQQKGITTVEVKSGYGLSVTEELKMLRAIDQANKQTSVDLISTCLAAHIVPKDYHGKIHQYLEEIIQGVFSPMKLENICNRVDAFIEKGAFSPSDISTYLRAAKNMNFDITIHADQFHAGGSEVAVEYGAVSADHLEASGEKEIRMIADSNVVATALPGASLGLGVDFAPARKILNAGGALAIASDWNPGSAPMGDLLTAASILGTFEKLSNAEVLAGITFRAAHALRLKDRGKLVPGRLADFVVFPTGDYSEILYHQGQLLPSQTWKRGTKL